MINVRENTEKPSIAKKITCPSCGYEYSDDWELLTLNTTHAFRCECCAHAFVVTLAVCNACETQSPRITTAQAEVAAPSLYLCTHCLSDPKNHWRIIDGDDVH